MDPDPAPEMDPDPGPAPELPEKSDPEIIFSDPTHWFTDYRYLVGQPGPPGR